MTRDSRESNAGSPTLLFTHYSRAAFACKTAKALRTGFPKRNRAQLSKNAWTPVNSHVLLGFYLAFSAPVRPIQGFLLIAFKIWIIIRPLRNATVFCGGKHPCVLAF